MTIQELATLVQDHIPVRIALLDNKKLGMIGSGRRSSTPATTTRPTCSGRTSSSCASVRIPAWKATSPEEVRPAIVAAEAVDGPSFVWFEIAEEQNVFPMMPAGKGLSDLIEKWGGADE